ncbi:MAG: hypothetical protein ACYC21_10220 [Eubacteriales bacterium]
MWAEFVKKVKDLYIVFGSNDPYCDKTSAEAAFPRALVDSYPGADHGLSLDNNYAGTIDIQREIIEKTKKFITMP